MKTVLVAVISCTAEPYPMLLRAQLATWDSVPVEGVQTFYYAGRKESRTQMPDCCICFEVPEHYNTMGRKNLLAYRWALDHFDWDYMARVNASCYVRKRVLLDEIQRLPDSNVAQGVPAPGPDNREYLWGGAMYILSRDVVKALVDHQHRWNHGRMEDVAMSHLLQDLGIPFRRLGKCGSVNRKDDHWLFLYYDGEHGGGFEFTDFKDVAKAADQYFIRVKQDLKRDQDVWIMNELHRNGL